MFKIGDDILFQEPAVSGRRLRRSVVVATANDSLSVRFVGKPFEFAVDQEVLMYFTVKREFMQQVGRITAIELPPALVAPEAPAAESAAKTAPEPTAAVAEAPPVEDRGPVFVLEAIGDPISAESRQYYRVSTISAKIEARFGKGGKLQVQDLSATGFAVLADEKFKIGQLVDVSIRHEDEACHGKVAIQSFRELESGKLRYGLRAIEEDPHARDFLKTLHRISLAVQRDQLARTGSGS